MNPPLVNIRGTNGSGKTTLAREILGKEYETIETCLYSDKYDKEFLVPLNISKQGIVVVGKYAGVNCGGCDTIKTQDLIRLAVDEGLKIGPTLFEGILVSHIYGKWKLFGEPRGMVWAFIRLPLNDCLQRVYARNGGKALKNDGQSIKDKHRAIERVREKATQDGLPVLDLLPGKEVDQLLEVLRA